MKGRLHLWGDMHILKAWKETEISWGGPGLGGLAETLLLKVVSSYSAQFVFCAITTAASSSLAK